MSNILKTNVFIISIFTVFLTASVYAQGLSISDQDLSEYKTSEKTVVKEKATVKKVHVEKVKTTDEKTEQKTGPKGALSLDDNALDNFTGEKREWPVEGMPTYKEKHPQKMISGEDLIRFGMGASGMGGVAHEPAMSDEAWDKYLKKSNSALKESNSKIEALRLRKAEKLEKTKAREEEISIKMQKKIQEMDTAYKAQDKSRWKELRDENEQLSKTLKEIRTYAHELKFLNITNYGDGEYDLTPFEKALDKPIP